MIEPAWRLDKNLRIINDTTANPADLTTTLLIAHNPVQKGSFSLR